MPETGPAGCALMEDRTVMIMKCESSPLNHSGSSSYISELFQIIRKYRKLMIRLLLFPLISKDQVLGPEETLIPIKVCMQMYESYSCEAARANTMTGGLDLSFGFPWNGKIPYPHQAAWSQPINTRPVRKRESVRGKLKSPGMPKFEKRSMKVWTNKIALQTCNQSLSQLPTAYAHPINLCNSLGSGLSDPAPLRWMQQEPWLESAINFPFRELHCLGSLLSSRSGIRTSDITQQRMPDPR